MSILKGTSQTRFPRFDDPNSGIGAVFDRANDTMQKIISENITSDFFRDSFVEDGVQNVPGFSHIDPSWSNIKKASRRTVITQRPKATVFVKKRMFSTLRNNFDIQFMSDEEKLFLRAVKNLFRRKCQEIAFYENLISVERIFDNKTGFLNINEFVDNYLDDFLSLLDTGFGIGSGLGNIMESVGAGGFLNDLSSSLSSFFGESPVLSTSAEIIEKLYRLRELNKRSKSNMFTTWIVDEQNGDYSGLGPGTGVIELNLVAKISTVSSTEPGRGGCSLTVEDPYRLLIINESDIETALRESLVERNGASGKFDITGTLQLKQAEALDRQLNSSRRARGVSEVNFEFVFGTEEGAQGIVVESRETFNESTISLVSDEQAFTAPELVRATQILQKMRSFKALQRRGLDQFKLDSEVLNGPRQRMRTEFLGHSIIQQMDSVHIFMNGQTRDETPISTGRQDISPLEFTSTFQQKIDALSTDAVRKEWEVIADPGIPFELYLAMRNPSFFRGDGVSVFAGLVTSTRFSYDSASGRFLLSVTAKDNTEFLRISRINKAPSLIQPGGILSDPITPFDLSTNSTTGLLDKVPELSDDNKKRLKYLRFDDGDNVGALVDEEKNLFRDKTVVDGGKEILEYDHVPGLIYTWKKGIVSATLSVNGHRTPSGSGSGLGEISDLFGITVQDNPFGNLDAADIMSVLITGRPYNYSSFLKSAIDSGTYSIDSSNNNRFLFNYLFDFFDRQSQANGSFIPAKSEVLDPRKASDAYKAKVELDIKLSALAKAVRRKAVLEDRRRGREDNNPSLSVIADDSLANINKTISDLNVQIESLKVDVPDSIKLNIFGNKAHLEIESDKDIRAINKKLSYRLKKKPEEVRYNLDKNYFVVSDKYDSDTDIQAFTRELQSKGPNLFGSPSSDYKDAFSTCVDTARKIDFEFFADPDGNIQFRPPQYNKTPLSLLIRLIELSKGDRTSLIPDFVYDLFKNRRDLLETDLLIRDLGLLENFILLGEDPESFGLDLALKRVELQDESVVRFEINSAVLRAQSFEGELFSQAQIASREIKQSSKFTIASLSDNEKPKLLSEVRAQLSSLTGRAIREVEEGSRDFIKYSHADENASVNKQKLRDKIASLVSERQLSIKAYRGLLNQGADLTVRSGDTAINEIKKSLASWASSFGEGQVGSIPVMPSFMEDLIENDLQNDDGFRSGKRFVVNDDVIFRMDIGINAPKFNRVDVQGNVDIVGSELKSAVPLIFWAGAVDFDSWRQFGYRGAQEFSRADFSSPESQCAPYAVFKLLQQRKAIHSGSITVVGNEFYRPGDVVYVNNKSMLYYVQEVKHDMGFSDGKFTTELKLSYGRALGDYLPTPLDVIGKGLLSNNKRALTSLKANRSAAPLSADIVNLGTLYVENYSSLGSGSSETHRKNFLKKNRDEIKNIVLRASSKINRSNDDTVRVEIRSYYVNQVIKDVQVPLSENFTYINSTMVGQWIKDELISPTYSDDSSVSEKLDSKKIQKFVINIGGDLTDKEKELRRFPSSQAWSGSSSGSIYHNGVNVPVNAIDIVFVVDSSRKGNKESEKLVDKVKKNVGVKQSRSNIVDFRPNSSHFIGK